MVRRWAQAVPVPWRNGSGITRELWREPAGGDPFEWRISVAQVDDDGPFSTFEGYERALVLLTGEGIDLHTPDEIVALRPPFGSHCFPGELAIHATLPGGRTTDFNLMWRRDVLDADVTLVELDGALEVTATDIVVCFVADGVVRIGGDELVAGDAVRLEGAHRVDGRGTLLVCSLRPKSA